MKRTLLVALWLPLTVAAQAVVRFGVDADMPPTPAPMMAIAVVSLFVFTWPAGIPLTAALRRLHSHSRFATYACAAVLGPLTAAAATVGGVLRPIAVWIYALVLSLPAWLVFWLFRVARRRAAPHPDR